MKLLTVFCLSLVVSLSWAQSAQIQASAQSNGQQGSASGTMSISGSRGRFIDLFLHPLRPFLGEAGHKALHNAIEVIPMSVLNQVSNLGQLFGALVTWNPTAIPNLISTIFPGATSMLSNILPTLGSAGLSALSSMATSGLSASGLNPLNIASDMVGQGMSNFAGISSSLANGQPLSALLTMAGGAADTANRFGNLATGMASRLPGPIGQMSSTFSSMIPGGSASARGSVSASANGGSYSGSSSASGSSSSGGRGRRPFSNLLNNNPFSSFLG